MEGIVLRACALALAFSATAPVGPSSGGGQWESNTDRPGADIRSFQMAVARPEACRDACWTDPQCRAFTYARPGALGPRALCYIKNAVPPARPADCCLSGVK